MGIRAKSVTRGYCHALKAEGLIDFIPGANRTVHLTPAGVSYLQDGPTARSEAPPSHETPDPCGLGPQDSKEALERKIWVGPGEERYVVTRVYENGFDGYVPEKPEETEPLPEHSP
jgi:hypothetical protein